MLLTEQLRGGVELDDADLADHRDVIFDYFAGEILDRADPDIATFLLETALLPRITAAGAEQLTGRRHAARILRDLTRRGYFTTRRAGSQKARME